MSEGQTVVTQEERLRAENEATERAENEATQRNIARPQNLLEMIFSLIAGLFGGGAAAQQQEEQAEAPARAAATPETDTERSASVQQPAASRQQPDNEITVQGETSVSAESVDAGLATPPEPLHVREYTQATMSQAARDLQQLRLNRERAVAGEIPDPQFPASVTAGNIVEAEREIRLSTPSTDTKWTQDRIFQQGENGRIIATLPSDERTGENLARVEIVPIGQDRFDVIISPKEGSEGAFTSVSAEMSRHQLEQMATFQSEARRGKIDITRDRDRNVRSPDIAVETAGADVDQHRVDVTLNNERLAPSRRDMREEEGYARADAARERIAARNEALARMREQEEMAKQRIAMQERVNRRGNYERDTTRFAQEEREEAHQNRLERIRGDDDRGNRRGRGRGAMTQHNERYGRSGGGNQRYASADVNAGMSFSPQGGFGNSGRSGNYRG